LENGIQSLKNQTKQNKTKEKKPTKEKGQDFVGFN